MIGILDYGMGNLRSVQKAFEKLGFDAPFIEKPRSIQGTELLVLPGVGAFDRAVENLKSRNLWEPTVNHLEGTKPYLGICLGLQLLFDGSEEGKKKGFRYFDGTVHRFRGTRPVPHMGWNDVNWLNDGQQFQPRGNSSCYFFVHSFYPEPENEDIIAGETEYGESFCAAVISDNTVGVQFHPEKSQYAGLDLLERICDRFLT